MKLFSSTEVITNKQQQTVSDIHRVKEVNELLEKRRKELRELEVDFDYVLEQQQNKWEEEKARNNKEINDLKSQVMQLEARRKQNLLPLEQQSEELDALKKKLAKKELDLAKKEEEMDEKLELLEEKLSEAEDREQELDRQYRLHAMAQEGIASQKANIALQAKELNSKLNDAFKEDKLRKNEILRLQATLDLKEKALQDKEKELKKIEAGFADRERAIKDRYETLQRTIAQSHLDK
jgi:chromosome segregation ATPase